ncbi:MAG: cell division protein FtsQ/DivIB [Notoacmeibacter sp.]
MRALRNTQDRSLPGLDDGARVLPRPLRLSIRFAGRFLSGSVQMPKYLGVSLAVGFLGLTGVYGAWQGGLLPGLVAQTANSAGLSIDAIKITGHQRTTQAEVLSALGFDANPSIVSLDVEKARLNLLQLPWVASASVGKAYPSAVSVEIVEKKASAIWQNGTEIMALDENGLAIGQARLAGDRALPAFVGEGADKTGLPFAAMVRELAPQLADQVKVYVRIADRRWDLLMMNGVTVKLPEAKPHEALVQLAAMQTQSDILARDVTSIDLRIAGRTALSLGETAMAQLFPPKEAEKVQ